VFHKVAEGYYMLIILFQLSVPRFANMRMARHSGTFTRY